jgi:carotenoid 1,2-hydratase
MHIIEEQIEAKKHGRLHFSSSIARDVWHEDARNGAYQWWYFDATSDDGRDTLVIIFLDNFIFSPRYNRAISTRKLAHTEQTLTHSSKMPVRFPAIAFCWYRNHRPLIRSINEFTADEFAARTDRPTCRIGQNSFYCDDSTSNPSYNLELATALRRGRRMKAKFTWEVIEGDFTTNGQEQSAVQFGHEWNLVAPRCRVTGALRLIEPDGRRAEEHCFQGLGYHDHNRDSRPMPATIAEWQWGRAHFPHATAVFYRYRERGSEKYDTRLFIVRHKELVEHEAHCLTKAMRRHFFGLRYPRALCFAAQDEDQKATLSVKQSRIIDGSFFYLRFLGRATLDCGKGYVQQAVAVTEQLAPHILQKRALWWLINMRIGRRGRASFLP